MNTSTVEHVQQIVKSSEPDAARVDEESRAKRAHARHAILEGGLPIHLLHYLDTADSTP